jgi:ferredoxin
MAFRDELAVFGARVTVAPQDEVGLPDLVGLLATPRRGALVYACGPAAMLDAVGAAMVAWPPRSLRVERFTAAEVGSGAEEAFEVEFAASGVTATVPADRSILAVAEEVGVPALWSCAEGTCGTCETPLLAGRAEHRDALLTDVERDDQDTIFICVSRAERGCPRLRLDL